MSLINDALKRAQENQPPAPVSKGPELRPVELDHTAARTAGLFWPILLTFLVLVGLVSLWAFSKFRNTGPSIQARALTPEVSPVRQPAATPALTPAASDPAQAVPAKTNQQSTAAANIPASPVASSRSVSNAAPEAASIVQPKPLKLQSIVMSRPPSAMISGQIVFTGDKIRDCKVAEIRADRVLLWSENGTISLTLR